MIEASRFNSVNGKSQIKLKGYIESAMKLKIKTVLFVLAVMFSTLDFAISSENGSVPLIDCKKIDWSEKLSNMTTDTLWSGSDRFFCIVSDSGIMYNLEPRTLFYDKIPKETTFSRYSASGPFRKHTVLLQNIKTNPLGKIWLNDKGKGPSKEEALFPSWYWKVFFSLLILVIIGFLLAAKFEPDQKQIDFTPLQTILVSVPLVPFLLLIGISLIAVLFSGLSSESLWDVFVDNATEESYTIFINGETVRLPAKSNLCLKLRRAKHTFKFKSKTTTDSCIFDMGDAISHNKYIINLKGANRYSAKVIVYQRQF